MARKQTIKTGKSPLEKFILVAKLPMLAISGWLLWRKYQRDQEEEELARLTLEAKRQALLSHQTGATRPLAVPAITPTSLNSPQVIYAPGTQEVIREQAHNLIDDAAQAIRAAVS
jgi:hypothetical protein